MAGAISRRGEFRTKLFRARGAHRKSHQCTIESLCCALFYYSEDFEEIRAVTQRLMLSPFEKRENSRHIALETEIPLTNRGKFFPQLGNDEVSLFLVV